MAAGPPGGAAMLKAGAKRTPEVVRAPDTSDLIYRGLEWCDGCGIKLAPGDSPWGLCERCQTPRTKERRGRKREKRGENGGIRARARRLPELTAADALIVDALVSGRQRTVSGAAHAVGVLEPGKYANDKLRKRIQAATAEILERAGAGKAFIARKVRRLMDAKTTKFFAHEGKVLDKRTVADNETQAKMTVEAAKMHGMYPQGERCLRGSGEHQHHAGAGQA